MALTPCPPGADRGLADFAKSIGAGLIIRGLRAVSDFEYEFQMNKFDIDKLQQAYDGK